MQNETQYGEEIIFSQGEILVTRARFVVSGQTYPIAGITSVRIGTKPASHTGSGLVMICGMLLFLASLFAAVVNPIRSAYQQPTLSPSLIWGPGWGPKILGALFVVGGIFWWCFEKPRYLVIVGTAGGDRQAYMSPSRPQIERIIDALNSAIVSRG
jgi:hypothetical protein